jgi:hypothetical protein
MADKVPVLEYFRGDTRPIPVVVKRKATGDIVNVENVSARLTVSSLQNPGPDDAPLFWLDGVITGDPANGLFLFFPSAEDTDLPKGVYWLDVQYTNADGIIETILKQNIMIKMDITK